MRWMTSAIGSVASGGWTRMPAMRLAISAEARTFTSSARLAYLGARTRSTFTFPSSPPRVSSTATSSPSLIDASVNSKGTVTSALPSSDLRQSTRVMARPGQMATHFSHPMHSPSKVGRPRMSSPSMRIEPLAHTLVHGLQGISCEQWITG